MRGIASCRWGAGAPFLQIVDDGISYTPNRGGWEEKKSHFRKKSFEGAIVAEIGRAEGVKSYFFHPPETMLQRSNAPAKNAFKSSVYSTNPTVKILFRFSHDAPARQHKSPLHKD